MVHVLRRREAFEELHHTGLPSGDVERELLEHRRGAFAAQVGDRVGDLGPRRGDPRGLIVERPVSDEITDVGDHPIGGRLRELVVIELIETLLDDAELRLHDVEQLPQLAGVADPVHPWQQVIELGHGISSIKRSLSSNSSAPRRPGVGPWAMRRGNGFCIQLRVSTSRSTATTPAARWATATTSDRWTGRPKSRAAKPKAAVSAPMTACRTVSSS